MKLHYDEESPSGLLRNMKPCGYLNKGGYYVVKINYKQYKVHRLVWELIKGPIPEGFVVDHIDGDKTNNRIENLRIVKPRDNSRNSKLYSTNNSGISCFRHVSNRKYYQAYCTTPGGKRVSKTYPYGKVRTQSQAKEMALKEAELMLKSYHNNHGRK